MPQRTRRPRPGQNPFPYAQVVTGKDFADRRREVQELRRALTSGDKILISSPRRFGKTSLVFETVRRLGPSQLTFIYLDLMRATSLEHFIELYAAAQARVDGAPEVSVRLPARRRDTWQLLAPVLDAPERLAAGRSTPVAVVLDEFQEIGRIDPDLAKELRAKLQFHTHCAYVFMGSKRHMLSAMFADESGPLFKLARPLVLERIERLEFARFIAGRFEDAGAPVPESVIDQILAVTDGHPYYTQLLCHDLYDMLLEGEPAAEGTVEEAVSQAVRGQSQVYLTLWDGLTSKQRALLLGLATEGGKAAVFSGSFVSSHGLTSAATAQRAVKALEDKGVVEREPDGWALSDVFLATWIREEIARGYGGR